LFPSGNAEYPRMKASGKPVKPAIRRHLSNSPGEVVLDQLFVWLDNSLVLQTASELARQCQVALWEATCDRIIGMSRDDAREYLRAHAGEFLVRKVAIVLQRRRVRESLRLKILSEAAEHVVELVMKDLHRAKSRRPASRAA
jgi:hypothetical protein